MSLRELADRVGGGVHFTTLGKLESGRTKLSMEWVSKIAPALGVAPLELLDGAYSQYSIKAVPLYPVQAFEHSDIPDATFRVGYAPATVGQMGAYAINVALSLGDSSDTELKPGFFVVDSLLKAAVDGSIQVLRLDDRSLFVGKYDARGARYHRWLSFGDKEVLVVGQVGFYAIGSVVFVGYYP